MCGIAGIWTSERTERVTDRIVAMTEAIRHRGPDDGGFQIIDVGEASPSGWSPPPNDPGLEPRWTPTHARRTNRKLDRV